MPNDPNSGSSGTIQTPPPPEPTIVVDGVHSGVIRHGGMVIGSFDANVGIVLDLGWCRMAGIGVRLLDDKTHPTEPDNHRGGVAFERKAKG